MPRVSTIDQLSFPTPWPASAFLYEFRQSRSHYYVLLRPPRGKPTPSWRRWLRRAFGLSGKSRVIGYVGFRMKGANAHVSTISVHPDWRRMGFGELLLLTALEEALRHQASLVTLEARPSNRAAHQLYRKFGFQREDIHQAYYRDGEDAWLMAVDVSSDESQKRLAILRQKLEDRFRRQQIDIENETGRLQHHARYA